MGDSVRNLLNHYNLTTLNPTEWPPEKEESDSSEDEEEPVKPEPRPNTKLFLPVRRKSRYSALLRMHTSRTTSMLGAQHGHTAVQKDDERDPLGGPTSVIQSLRQRGVSVDEDARLRHHFLLSSNTFSPTMFLSEVHSADSTEELLRGLDHLSRSIEMKSASLKVLVGQNFEKFVRAKATIDNVYTEMRKFGAEPDLDRRPWSRSSGRLSSGIKQNGQLSPASPGRPNERKKSALLKESEFGISGIKAPLIDAAVKAEEVWGPALGGQEREENLRSALNSIEKNHGLIQVASSLEDAIKRRDYRAIVEEYGQALNYASKAKALAQAAKHSQDPLDDQQVHQVILTLRMWMEVETRLDEFKRQVWRQLADSHFARRDIISDTKPEEHMELINVLLELGVEDNPIWVWLLSRYDYLKNAITRSCERSRVEIEVLRRKLTQADKPNALALSKYLKTALSPSADFSSMDSSEILRFWNLIHAFLHGLLSIQDGLLGEVIDFWSIVQSFAEGWKSKSLPNGIGGQSMKHHQLSREGVKDLAKGARDLFSLIRKHVYELFGEPPIDDISSLFSPVPPTPLTPKSVTLTPSNPAHFTFDPASFPPPSPKTGEKWDNCAFWPPHSSSLSAVNFLSKIINLIGISAGEIAALEIVKRDSRLVDEYKHLIGTVRERIIAVICSAWLSDSENCRHLEDWTPAIDKSDQTNLPSYFRAFESNILTGLQKALYLPDAVSCQGATLVINPPSHRHVETVQKGLKHSLYKAFSGMMEHAAKPVQINGQSTDDDSNGLIVPASKELDSNSLERLIDVKDMNIRKLLTMSNFQALRSDVVPGLISQFESNFLMTITEDSKQARDVLTQMHARVFQSYVKAVVSQFKTIINAGITSPTWAIENHRPTDARPYVYEVLLNMVIVHTEVTNTAASLTSPILSHLLDQVSLALIDSFKRRPKYSLSALMQATLDVEFMAQTLNNFTTEKASETQSQIYLALDERTDNDARMRLQNELPEMRAILKRLRENTKSEFACFKRQRTHRERKEGSQ